MKQCPRCNRTYSDDTLNFCLEDGSTLIPAFDTEATQRRAMAETMGAKTLVVPAQSSVSRQPDEKPKWPWLVALFGLLFVLLLFIGVAGVLLYPKLTANSNNDPTPTPTATPAVSPSPNLSPSPSPRPTAAVMLTPRSTPSPGPSPTGTVDTFKRPEENFNALPGRFPEASIRLLNKRDFNGKNCFDLKIMRNEVFARHGFIFKTPDMITYFSNQPWYRPQFDEVASKLSSTEAANVRQIKNYESELYCK
jgi:hypothetical protein